MKLSAPTQLVFIIAAVLAILGLLAGPLGMIAALGTYAGWLSFFGWALLAIGCFFKGA
ncbi:MAG: hypothetical protein U0470_11415 [Anaerolineae bacterium]